MITILSEPTTGLTHKWNTLDFLPFVVSSNFSNRKSFRYIADIYKPTNILVSSHRFHKDTANLDRGYFDAVKVLQNKYSYDLDTFVTLPSTAPSTFNSYQVRFGEEFSREINISSVSNQGGNLRIVFNTVHNLRTNDRIRLYWNNPSLTGYAGYYTATVVNTTTINTNLTWSSSFTGQTGFVIEAEGFTDNYYSPLNGVEYTGFIVPQSSRPTRIRVGDTVVVQQDAGFTHARYNSTAEVLLVDTVNVGGTDYDRIVTSIRWAGSSPTNAGAIYSTNNYILKNLVNSADNSFALNSNLGYLDWKTFDNTEYSVSGVSRKFLTNAPRPTKIGLGQYHTLSVINGTSFTTSLFDAISVKVYDEWGTELDSDYLPITGNNNANSQLWNIPSGTANLNTVSFSGAAYYTVQGINYDSPDDEERTELYRFDIDEECTKYGTFRLVFQNKFGCFDYFNFTKNNVKTITSERSTFERKYGTPTTAWTYSIGERGTTTFNLTSRTSYVATSRYLTEAEMEWLKELFESKEVYLIDGLNVLPITITDSSFVETKKYNSKLFDLTINFEMAYKNQN